MFDKEFFFYSEGWGVIRILFFNMEDGLEEIKAEGREIS